MNYLLVQMNMDTKEAYPRVHIREMSVLQKYLSL